MKRTLAVALTLAMLLGLSGCSSLVQMFYGGGSRLSLTTQRMLSLLAGSDLGNAIGAGPGTSSGDIEGEVGELYSTEWFDFRVDAMYVTDGYKGVEADEGYAFLVATVYELNNWHGNDDIPMSNYDFYALADDDSREIDPEDAWDEAMMPDVFYLEPEEEATYDVVFTVPHDVESVKFVYVELDDQGDTYATFTIKHDL